ncbi:MAG TPA: adenylate/guanylate cyclase domain-containing protein, partial [Acidimicrobiales bacterium]
MGEAKEAMPSGTVTFLLTDVVGSTPLWERDADLMAASLAIHRRTVEDAITRNHGVRPLEQGEGDSMVVAFERASDAVAAALEAQLALEATDWSGGPALSVRMALHTGNATAQPDRTYQGATIIRCARLRSLATGGQVLLSSSTVGLLADALPAGCRLDEAGSFHLKGLRRPETVFQLQHPALPTTLPPLPDSARSNLQPALTSFVGRRAELTELEGLLAVRRCVTLTGAGGCGKTRLALELAARRVDEHVGGAWWVDLALVGSEPETFVAIAHALSISEEIGRPVLDTLLDHLGRTSGLLLVLDNAEHLLEPVARFVTRALSAAPDLAVVVTSREPLSVPGEVTVRVPSLDVDQDAVDLFADRAAAARPALRLDDSAREVIAR